jgi:hypothetical protein
MPDPKLYPALLLIERLIRSDFEAKRFGIELQCSRLIPSRYPHELDMRNHFPDLQASVEHEN